MADTVEKKPGPSPGSKWAPGAEPLALCMSCNATYPAEATECPNCQVGLSLVRKCPSCERVQSAQHLTCIYCANSFMQEDGLSVLAAGPLRLRQQRAKLQLRIISAIVGVLIVAAALLTFYVYAIRGRIPTGPMARSFVAAHDSVPMRKEPSNDAPPVKSLQPSQKVDITECAYDSAGNRWFRITSDGISGFVRTEDVAPPEATKANPEGGFVALRHSLLHLGDAAMLDYAREAVDYYHSIFPGNVHADELTWLLAEQTRELAERSNRSRDLLASAREQYRKLAESGGEYAARAREALDQLPTSTSTQATPSRAAQPRPLQFSVIGGSTSLSQPSSGMTPGAPVRKVTVLSRTPLVVSLTAPLEIVPGAQGEGEIAEDIRVKSDLAVPRGSRARLSVASNRLTSGTSSRGSSLTLRLTALVIGDQTYGVSALSAGDHVGGTLARGTRIEFRLAEPLYLPER